MRSGRGPDRVAIPGETRTARARLRLATVALASIPGVRSTTDRLRALHLALGRGTSLSCARWEGESWRASALVPASPRSRPVPSRVGEGTRPRRPGPLQLGGRRHPWTRRPAILLVFNEPGGSSSLSSNLLSLSLDLLRGSANLSRLSSTSTSLPSNLPSSSSDLSGASSILSSLSPDLSASRETFRVSFDLSRVSLNLSRASSDLLRLSSSKGDSR